MAAHPKEVLHPQAATKHRPAARSIEPYQPVVACHQAATIGKHQQAASSKETHLLAATQPLQAHLQEAPSTIGKFKHQQAARFKEQRLMAATQSLRTAQEAIRLWTTAWGCKTP